MSITPKDPLSWTSPVNPVVIPGAGSSYLCSFTVAFLDVQYIDHVIWGLLNLVSLCKMFFEVHLYCNMCQYFYCWTVFHCMDKPHFVGSPTQQLADMELILVSVSYEYCCCEYLWTCFCMNRNSSLGSGIAGTYGKYMQT